MGSWVKIRDIIHSVPGYEECLEKMKVAGCKLKVEDIEKPREMEYSSYMRYILMLLRLLDIMID